MQQKFSLPTKCIQFLVCDPVYFILFFIFFYGDVCVGEEGEGDLGSLKPKFWWWWWICFKPVTIANLCIVWFEPALNLCSGFLEWRCVVVTTAPCWGRGGMWVCPFPLPPYPPHISCEKHCIWQKNSWLYFK